MPGESDGDGLFDIIVPDQDSAAGDFGAGLAEFFVGASDFEPSERSAIT